MSQNHSSEWLRGRKEGLRALKDRIGGKRNTMLATWGSYTAMDVEVIINDELAMLAEAEDREFAQPTAAEVIAEARQALEIARQQFGSHAGEQQNEELCEQALARIAAWEAAQK